jgi:NADH-quinone oxidoreductase subunit N
VIDIGLVWLALLAVAFSIIGAFYYLRVVKMIYFDKAEIVAPVDAGTGARFAVTVNGLAMLALGMFPAALLSLCEAAFH